MEITIEKLIYGGEGLAHHDGSTVFVPFVLPAERVSAQLVEQKKKFIRARVDRLIEPSLERTVAQCPHFGVCGGCDYQHIPYEAQLKYKTDILRETLRRIGQIDWTGEITTHASPPWAYRNRAQWKIRPLAIQRTIQSRAKCVRCQQSTNRRTSCDRIFSRQLHGSLRGRGLLDYFAAAAEDSARSSRRARCG